MFTSKVSNSVTRKAILMLAVLSVTSTGFAGGGSGGGGSSSGGGGGGKTCSVISSFHASSSTWPITFAEVKIDYILKGCAPGFVPSGTATVTNLDAVDGPSTSRDFSALFGRIYFESPAVSPFNTNIRVDFVVKDPATGAVIESRTTTMLTVAKP